MPTKPSASLVARQPAGRSGRSVFAGWLSAERLRSGRSAGSPAADQSQTGPTSRHQPLTTGAGMQAAAAAEHPAARRATVTRAGLRRTCSARPEYLTKRYSAQDASKFKSQLCSKAHKRNQAQPESQTILSLSSTWHFSLLSITPATNQPEQMTLQQSQRQRKPSRAARWDEWTPRPANCAPCGAVRGDAMCSGGVGKQRQNEQRHE